MEGIVHEQEGEGRADFRGVEWTKEEVRTATARLIEGMTSDGGGYIVAASHIIPPQTRDDNIFHMYAGAGKRSLTARHMSVDRWPKKGI